MAKLVKKSRRGEAREAPEPSFYANLRRMGSLAAQHKALHLRAYDVRGLTVLADAFIICSAASEPQLRAIFNSLKEGMKEIGVVPLHTEGTFHGGWMVMDYGDIIVHVFREEAREFYDLDGFWGDAPEVKVDE